ncbi:unnamed protein product, partial [Medioppia subpectinata]
MLYIFLVESGSMMTFDMNLALQTKESIESLNPPKCVTEYDPDVDMADRVQSCVDMNPSIHTV